MEIHYDLTEDDYLQFNLYHVKQSKTAVRALNLQRFVTPIFFIVIAFIFYEIGDLPLVFPIVIFGAISVVWMLFYPKYFYRVVSRQSKKMLKEGNNQGLLGKQEMVLSTSGFTYITANGESKVKWSGIKKVIETEDYVYFYNSAISAYILPKRAVSNLEEAKAYFKSQLVETI